MSRSYKHTLYAGDNKARGFKQVANRKCRRNKFTDSSPIKSNNYKKIFESWNICDYGCLGPSFEEYYEDRKNFDKRYNCIKSRKEYYREWYKTYRRK